jgi:DNA anti-recombination protein RmuC
MTELNREEIRERLGNIDQIRDIIFGPQLREYNSRLDKIESNLSLMEQEMRERIEQVKNACLTEVRASVDSLEQKIKSSNLNYQNENAELRQLIDRVNKKFSSSIEALDQTIDSQTSSIWNNLSETKEKLQEDNRNLRIQIFEELERRFTTLSGAKVSRDDMAEILFELGLRIKGTEFAPELKDAAGTDVSPDIRLLEATRISE